ncbi:MAG: DUF2165 family protein [Xanthomonadales bacterium]|jgi:predicted small integral membrane protein|nr:DUF2165 family protein [Xanthomonadales bacterium]
MHRFTQLLLVLAVALWGLLGGLGNLASYQAGMESVETVLSMETLPEGSVSADRKPPPRALVTLGFAFIWALKLIGGTLCLVGAVQMWISRKADASAFQEAKRWAIAGCGVLIFMLFFGFSFVAVGPYKLFLSPLISAVELAALFAVQIGIVMLFLNQRER